MTLTNAGEKNQCFRGIIVPSEWDDKGNPVSVELSTYDEEQYSLVVDSLFVDIMAFIYEQVEIIGSFQYLSGHMIIIVHQIRRCFMDNSCN